MKDSDATLIVNLGELEGGTLATQIFADKSGKLCLVVQVDSGISEGMPSPGKSPAGYRIGWINLRNPITLAYGTVTLP